MRRDDITEFSIQVTLAGQGSQMEVETSKRRAIRRCREMVKVGAFGSAGAVTMIAPAIKKPSGQAYTRRTTLIYQCHMALAKGKKKPVLKVDEL